MMSAFYDYYCTEDKIKQHLHGGGNPNEQDIWGRTFLHYARDEASVKLLLDSGADPKGKSFYCGSTPLHWQTNEGSVKLLLEAKIDPNATSNNGETALHLVKDEKVMQILLQWGADTNAKNTCGATPLHYYRDEGIVKLLLKAGADPNAKNNIGDTPLHWAKDEGSVRLLLEAGADANAINDNLLTPREIHSKVNRVYKEWMVKKLQRFARKNFRYFVFKRWIKSKAGVEYLYQPNKIGGRIAKQNLSLFIEQTTKKQS